jgi:hypothetical protein
MIHFHNAALTWAVLAWLVPAAPAADNETVKGRIQEVRASAHRLTVTTEQGKELTLRVDENSRLEKHGRRIDLDQLHDGMRVQATYEARGGENHLVSLTTVPVRVEDLKKEIHEALRDAKAYTFQHKDEYRQRLQGILGQLDEQIDQLEQQMSQAGSQARKEFNEQLPKLRRLRDRVQAQAERVKAASPQAWEDIKAGVGAALEDLGQAFQKAGERFR